VQRGEGAERRSAGKASSLLVVLPLAIVLLAGAAHAACGDEAAPATPSPTPALVGQRFPSVVGEDLTERSVSLPEDFAGAPLLVLIAPGQDAQADAGRFIAALRRRSDVVFVETPVLPSLVTRLLQGYINGKLREDEPRDVWPRIVPLYHDGDVLARFVGSAGDETATSVAVLDRDGVIRYYDDGGFSEATLAAALATYDRLRE
jgi:hypothetical protein